MRSVASLPAAKAQLSPPDADLSGTCGVLIPAYNEADTVATVIRTALAAALGPVLVVDDGSTDATTSAALAAGAAVLTLGDNLGKGGAVYEGATALQTDFVVLIDADLVGLLPEHLKELARPVLEHRFDMTRGVFAGGRWRTTAAQNITPQLNGQRALTRRKLLNVPGLAKSRYGIEIAITEQAKRSHWRTTDIAMRDVSQVMKEEKRGFLKGVQIRLGMYRDILKTWIKNLG